MLKSLKTGLKSNKARKGSQRLTGQPWGQRYTKGSYNYQRVDKFFPTAFVLNLLPLKSRKVED